MSSYFKNTLNSYKSLTSSNNTETLLRDIQEYINIVSSPYCVGGGQYTPKIFVVLTCWTEFKLWNAEVATILK